MGWSTVAHRSLVAAALFATVAGLAAAPQDPARVTFRSTLDLVSVAVVVRDGNGRLVTGLKANDFEVVDAGTPRPVSQFQEGLQSDARLALLLDSSGSMVVGPKQQRARTAADLLITGLRRSDAAAVFSFDSGVRRLTPYTADPDTLRSAIASVEPFGATSLYDAIVNAAQIVEEDSPRARALVLLTDGVDTASLSSAEDAAVAAAKLDLPVYAVGVGGSDATDDRLSDNPNQFSLADLARRTGGASTEASSSAQLSTATRSILDELHHQYVLAFDAGSTPGWHSLQVRVRRGRVNARSRDGYFVR
jgi:Ca-activated chloride channel family protein